MLHKSTAENLTAPQDRAGALEAGSVPGAWRFESTAVENGKSEQFGAGTGQRRGGKAAKRRQRGSGREAAGFLRLSSDKLRRVSLPFSSLCTTEREPAPRLEPFVLDLKS